MEFRILGPLDVSDEGTKPAEDVGGARARAARLMQPAYRLATSPPAARATGGPDGHSVRLW